MQGHFRSQCSAGSSKAFSRPVSLNKASTKQHTAAKEPKKAIQAVKVAPVSMSWCLGSKRNTLLHGLPLQLHVLIVRYVLQEVQEKQASWQQQRQEWVKSLHTRSPAITTISASSTTSTSTSAPKATQLQEDSDAASPTNATEATASSSDKKATSEAPAAASCATSEPQAGSPSLALSQPLDTPATTEATAAAAAAAAGAPKQATTSSSNSAYSQTDQELQAYVSAIFRPALPYPSRLSPAPLVAVQALRSPFDSSDLVAQDLSTSSSSSPAGTNTAPSPTWLANLVRSVKAIVFWRPSYKAVHKSNLIATPAVAVKALRRVSDSGSDVLHIDADVFDFSSRSISGSSGVSSTFWRRYEVDATPSCSTAAACNKEPAAKGAARTSSDDCSTVLADSVC